jgi:hypothetical protein
MAPLMGKLWETRDIRGSECFCGIEMEEASENDYPPVRFGNQSKYCNLQWHASYGLLGRQKLLSIRQRKESPTIISCFHKARA